MTRSADSKRTQSRAPTIDLDDKDDGPIHEPAQLRWLEEQPANLAQRIPNSVFALGAVLGNAD